MTTGIGGLGRAPARPNDGTAAPAAPLTEPRRPAPGAGGSLLSGLAARATPASTPPGAGGLAPRTGLIGKRSRSEASAVTEAAAGSSGASMPAGASGSRGRKMSATLIARALQMLAADPLRTRGSIAAELAVLPATLQSYIGPASDLRKIGSVANFPDYAAHAASIDASLRTLGRAADADGLRAASAGDVKRPRLEAASGSDRALQLAQSTVSAEQVFNAMSARAADPKSACTPSMKRWLSASTWKRTDLGGRLSKYADYPAWRERIELVAKRIGLLEPGQALPQPAAKARTGFDAHMLVSVLRQIQQRQHATAAGRLDDPSLAQPLFLAAGTTKGMVANWVRAADGKLHKPPSSIAKLPGYGEVHEEIRRLQAELGHAEAAAALPAERGAVLQVGAGLVARMLTAAADNAGTSRRDVASAAGVTAGTLLTYIAPDGGLNDPGKVAAMPDYALHADSIRAALQRLGRTDQAAAMPAAATEAVADAAAGEQAQLPARQFLDRAGGHLDKIVAAAELLRANPELTMREATQQAGAWRAAVRVFFDARGALRDAESVERALSGVGAGVKTRLHDLMARLSQRLAPRAAVLEGEAAMKTLRLDAAGYGADRVLVVGRHTVDPGLNARGRRASIYAQNPTLVHGPRPFAADPQRQPLRWLATVLKERFPRGIEVQCHFDAASRTLVVASNVADTNAAIQKFLSSGELQRLLAEPPVPTAADAPRAGRHLAKLQGRLDPASDPHPTPASDEILAAIAEGRFHVPRRRYVEDGKAIDMHAERRIVDYVRDELGVPGLDRQQLAGTMRPCGTCADELGAGPGEHRGPFWMSGAGRAGRDDDADIDRNAHEGVGTSITRTRGGRLTFGQDTDSDSDA